MNDRVPNKLRIYRKRANLTQDDVASILGLGKRGSDSILRWEKGYSLPNFRNLLQLSILYNTTPENLYNEFIGQFRNELAKKLKPKK